MTVGRLFGARILLNRYFLLAMALFAAAGLFAEALMLFTVVFLHEMGHVVAARRAGLDVAEVELLPFGGVARVEGLIDYDPVAEVGIALAGPLVNAVLMGLWSLADLAAGLPREFGRAFLEANAVIGGFNLLPALPLDGGRVLRALLSRRVGFRRATKAAVAIGRAVAALVLAAGAALLANGAASATIVLVPAFLFVSAGKEEGRAAYTFVRHLIQKRADLKRPGCRTCRHLAAGAETPLKDVVREFVPHCYHVVWVVGPEGKVTALASEAEVIDAVFERGMHEPVGSVGRAI